MGALNYQRTFCACLCLHIIKTNDFRENLALATIKMLSFMKALDEFGTNKDFTGICKLWIATGGKRCTDESEPPVALISFLRNT